jgi:RimJ/RimL family protein N-acetyltransferase
MIFGDTIALGPILPVDLPDLFQWVDNPDTAQFNEPYRPPNWNRQEAFWLNADADPTRVFFAIRSRETAAILGYVQIMQIDPIHRSATLGILIGNPGDRGQGRGREALSLAVRYCWNDLNLGRLALSVFAGTDRATGLYLSLGFREEGRLRQARFIDGQWIDVILMGLLHPERLHR